MIQRIGNAKMLLLRGRLDPLIDLSAVLGMGSERTSGFHIALLEAKGRRFGLVVDELAEPQEIVVRPLSSCLAGLNVYSGASILGDGQIALILDTTSLARAAKLCDTGDQHATHSAKDEGPERAATSSEGVPVLLFEDYRGEVVVVPLGCVERIERIAPEAVETLLGEGVMQYRGEVVEIEDAGCLLGSRGAVGEPRMVLVCEEPGPGGRRMGLVVRNVLDIADAVVLPSSSSRTAMVVRVNGHLARCQVGFESGLEGLPAASESRGRADPLKEAA